MVLKDGNIKSPLPWTVVVPTDYIALIFGVVLLCVKSNWKMQ